MAVPETDAISQDASDTDPVAKHSEVATENPENSPESPSDIVENPKPEEVISPRQEAMNRLVELRKEEQSAEIKESSGQATDDSPGSEKPLQTMTVKVDGIEQEMPIDEARAVIQKNLAADKRLNDAVLRQQQLQQWEQKLVQREQQFQAKPTVQSADTGGDLKEQVQTAVDKLYDGDTDEAVEALTGIIEGRNQATPINTDAIVAQAKEEVLQIQRKDEFEKEVMTARSQFNEQFKELAEVPELMDQADQRTITLMNEHPDWTPTQIIMEAGRKTQEFVNNIRGDGADNGQTTRSERKANIKPMPRSNGSINYQTEAPKPEKISSKQVISQMREARGQA